MSICRRWIGQPWSHGGRSELGVGRLEADALAMPAGREAAAAFLGYTRVKRRERVLTSAKKHCGLLWDRWSRTMKRAMFDYTPRALRSVGPSQSGEARHR